MSGVSEKKGISDFCPFQLALICIQSREEDCCLAGCDVMRKPFLRYRCRRTKSWVLLSFEMLVTCYETTRPHVLKWKNIHNQRGQNLHFPCPDTAWVLVSENLYRRYVILSQHQHIWFHLRGTTCNIDRVTGCPFYCSFTQFLQTLLPLSPLIILIHPTSSRPIWH
jgi:hypothetical protein